MQVSPDSGPELKEALTVCENAVKSSENLSLAVRAPLLAMWVRCKQLLREPIPSKTLGVDDMVWSTIEKSLASFKPFSKLGCLEQLYNAIHTTFIIIM